MFPIIYSKIDKNAGVPDRKNTSNCESFKEDKLNNYNNAVEFTKLCAKTVESQNVIVNDPKFSEAAYCEYINYWIYDTLKSMDSFHYSSLLDKFYEKLDNLKNCRKYETDITPEMHEKLKDLYDLYDDFNNFKTESLDDLKGTCQYGKTCVEKYNKYVQNCKSYYKNGLCMNLIYFKREYDDHITNITNIAKCKHKIKYLEPIKSDLSSIILIPFVVIILISFILLFLYKVSNNTILNIF
ncbi:hypothetical protein PVIIG_06248 [Plasmodium vivax India VII]|uniref:Uncharacterized protein n=1 Tax=Plasmodium vivax India VII TaxID=1077284 RepID=A0A0J9S2D4_PLAVI|nr:hypothetical protein PVIIG_06248 [Plasmodium vivax India VII]